MCHRFYDEKADELLGDVEFWSACDIINVGDDEYELYEYFNAIGKIVKIHHKVDVESGLTLEFVS